MGGAARPVGARRAGVAGPLPAVLRDPRAGDRPALPVGRRRRPPRRSLHRPVRGPAGLPARARRHHRPRPLRRRRRRALPGVQERGRGRRRGPDRVVRAAHRRRAGAGRRTPRPDHPRPGLGGPHRRGRGPGPDRRHLRPAVRGQPLGHRRLRHRPRGLRRALGPCRKPRDGPLLATTGAVAGPGSPDLFLGMDGALWLAYHAWTAPDVGYPRGARTLRVEPIAFVDGAPVVRGPLVGAVPRVRAHRLAGADRFATAAALSAASFPGPVPAVTVATGVAFPDALAAAPSPPPPGARCSWSSATACPRPPPPSWPGCFPPGWSWSAGPRRCPRRSRPRWRAAARRSCASTARTGWRRPRPSPGRPPRRRPHRPAGRRRRVRRRAGRRRRRAARGAPVLLTAAGELPAATADALRDLGTAEVVVVGGEQRVGGAVDGALAAAARACAGSPARTASPPRWPWPATPGPSPSIGPPWPRRATSPTRWRPAPWGRRCC